jgi:hypothetical protein
MSRLEVFSMEIDDLNYDARESALVRTILESRRALQTAISLIEDLMQPGAPIEWSDFELRQESTSVS